MRLQPIRKPFLARFFETRQRTLEKARHLARRQGGSAEAACVDSENGGGGGAEAPSSLCASRLAVYQGGYCGRIVVLCLPKACLREKHPTADAASTGLNRLLLPLLPRKPLRCAQPTTQDRGQRADRLVCSRRLQLSSFGNRVSTIRLGCCSRNLMLGRSYPRCRIGC